MNQHYIECTFCTGQSVGMALSEKEGLYFLCKTHKKMGARRALIVTYLRGRIRLDDLDRFEK